VFNMGNMRLIVHMLKPFSIVYRESGKAVSGLGWCPTATRIAQLVGFVYMLAIQFLVFYVFARGLGSLI